MSKFEREAQTLVSNGIEIDEYITKIELQLSGISHSESFKYLQGILSRKIYIRDILLFPMSAEEKLAYEQAVRDEEEKEADKTWEFLKTHWKARAKDIKTTKWNLPSPGGNPVS